MESFRNYEDLSSYIEKLWKNNNMLVSWTELAGIIYYSQSGQIRLNNTLGLAWSWPEPHRLVVDRHIFPAD